MIAPSFLGTIKGDFAPGEQEMTRLEELIAYYRHCAEAVAEKEAALKVAKEEFNRVAQQELPNLLLSNGFTEIKLKDGKKVTIKSSVDVSYKKEDEQLFFKFLKDRGEEAIIKTQYNFKKLDGETVTAIANFFADENLDYDVAESVHAQTKKAYFKRLVDEIGKEGLPEWMACYDVRVATIK